MRKASRKRALLYILLGIIIVSVFSSIIFFNSKKEDLQQNINKQNPIPVRAITQTSNSDLSYIKIVVDPDLDVKLLDMNGNQIAEAIIHQPITDPENSENKNESIKELSFQKPNTGSYQLITSSNINKISKISIYFYDINGDVLMAESETTRTAFLTIYFDKESSKRSYIKNRRL